MRRSSGSRSAHACARSPASAQTRSRLQTCPPRPASAPSARRLETRLGSRSVTPATGTCRSFPGAPQSGGLCPGIRCEPGAPTGVSGRPAGPPGHPGMADQAGVTLGSPGAHTWSSRPPWSPHICDRVDCCALAFGEKAPSPTEEGHGGGGRIVWDQRWVPCLALGSLCDPKVTLPHTVHCFLTNAMVAPRPCPGSPISCPQGSGRGPGEGHQAVLGTATGPPRASEPQAGRAVNLAWLPAVRVKAQPVPRWAWGHGVRGRGGRPAMCTAGPRAHSFPCSLT